MCMDESNDRGCRLEDSDPCLTSAQSPDKFCYKQFSNETGKMLKICFNQTALEQSAACAAQVGINYTGLEACYSSGRGDELLKLSNLALRKAYPAGESYSFPAIMVNGINIAMDDYAVASVEHAMCLAGATASVCKRQALVQ
jgi:hypothetical protein